LGINCEATNLDTIDVAHKGIFQCDIIFYGRAIHGSRPWLGINAIDKAVDFLNRMKILEEKLKLRKHPVLNYPTINVGTIHGGTVVNMIPSKCVVEINRRIIPGESFEMAKAEIQAILDQLSKEDPDFKAEIKVKDVNMPMLDVPADAPVVEAIRRAHKVVRGTELPIGGKDAGTDAAWIVQATGMPMPIYGPGDYLKYSLGANESIALEDIVDATKVYALAIYYLLGE
jgi:acetylornithine deacetylase/succinyl-diaminopimelate desuccinylase-like protein